MASTSTNLDDLIHSILQVSPMTSQKGETIGNSRQGRPLQAFRFGSGPLNVSLIAGCHADEPVGPRLLNHFVTYLQSLDPTASLLQEYTWWIIPHMNPDGEAINKAWYADDDEVIDPKRYLRFVVRDQPGDDIEFCFPRDENDTEARPENKAAKNWWSQTKTPFQLHASLHGMAIGRGPWFLVEKEWWSRCSGFRLKCEKAVKELGYILHDEERNGEKGFYRLAKGFCSRPDSLAMQEYFLSIGDTNTAKKFRPSSMETIRSFGGDPLTLVSEMPLFIIPEEMQATINPNELISKFRDWRKQINSDRNAQLPFSCELAPMPIKDQMILQWTMIVAGLAAIEA